MSFALTLSLLLGAAAVPAAERTARLVKRGSPKLALRKSPLAPAASGAGSSPSCGPGGCANLDVQYFGGRVLSNPKVYAVFWTNAVDEATRSGIGPFFRALTDSPMMDWLAEYDTDLTIKVGGSAGQQGTDQRIGRGAFAAGYAITPTLNTSSRLSDADIQAELDAQIAAGHLPENDANSVYLIYFPPFTVIDADGALSCQEFCAYHGTFARGADRRSTYYAVLPDFSGPDFSGGDCSAGCGDGSAFQKTTAASSHELLEAVTDPEVGLVTAFDRPLGWYDAGSGGLGEIGDMCNQQTDTLATPAGPYTVQQVYSQRTRLCQTSYLQPQDFALSLAPVRAKVMPGGAAATLPVAATNTAGEAQALALTLDASGLPPGVTATLDQTSIGSAGGSATLTLAATAAAAPAQDLMVVVTATGAGGVVHTAAALLQIGPPLVPSNPAVTLSGAAPGSLVSGTVTLVAKGQAASDSTLASVSLAIDGVQVATGVSSASYAWDTRPLAWTRPTLTATATDVDGASATTTLVVSVAGPPTASVTSPVSGAVVSGTVAVAATCAVAGGELDTLSLAIDGVRAAAGGLLTLSYDWDTTLVTNGPHLLGARASDWYGIAGTSAPVEVLVSNDFTLAVGPVSASASVGGAPAVFTVTTAAVAGAPLITLSASGLPAGVIASLTPAAVRPGESAKLVVTAQPGAVAGSSALVITGTSAGIPAGHRVTAALAVEAGAVAHGGCSSAAGAGWELLALLGLGALLRRGQRAG